MSTTGFTSQVTAVALLAALELASCKPEECAGPCASDDKANENDGRL